MPNVNFSLIFEGPLFDQKFGVLGIEMLQNLFKICSETDFQRFKNTIRFFRKLFATYWQFENSWNFFEKLHFRENLAIREKTNLFFKK